MTTPRYGTLFHFTHLDNLGSIFDAGQLSCDSAVCDSGMLATEAGDPQIKAWRRTRPVTVAPYGVVADYVPFYFAARSPMMYVLYMGRVPSFTGSHRDLIYFVTNVDDLAEADLPIVVTDRNAAKSIADFSNDLSVLGDLEKSAPDTEFIDWPLMRAKWWHDTLEQPDRMERRMAELLVHERVPLDVISSIGVYSARQGDAVRVALDDAGLAIRVVERPQWYF